MRRSRTFEGNGEEEEEEDLFNEAEGMQVCAFKYSTWFNEDLVDLSEKTLLALFSHFGGGCSQDPCVSRVSRVSELAVWGLGAGTG